MSEKLKDLLERKGFSAKESFQVLEIEPNYGYQVLNGIRKPPRELLLRASIVLELNLEETQDLLREYSRPVLYPRLPYDAAMIYAITHNCTPEETDKVLKEAGYPVLWEQ